MSNPRTDIFEVDGHNLAIDKDYIRGIPEFKVILDRDKGSKGDNDGRKKYRAYKEFLYIYLRGSMFSYIQNGGYNEKEAHALAFKDSLLEEGWKPDAAIKAALDKFKEIEIASMPVLNSIFTVLKALRLVDVLTQKILQDIESAVELVTPGVTDEPVNLAVQMAMHDTLLSKIDQVMAMAKKLPTFVETLEKLDERLKVEQAGSNIIRGGKTKGNRADPI